MMYGGNWHASLDGQTFDSINPANSNVIGEVPLGGRADARAAIDAAHGAFPSWSRRVAADRARLLHRLADTLEARRHTIARIITEEEGKPIVEALGEMR